MDKTVILHKRMLKDGEFSVSKMGKNLRMMCGVDDKFYYFNKKITKKIEQKLTNNEAAFDKFWRIYPKKVGKKAAESKFMNLKESSFDNIFSGLEQYLKQWDNRIKTNNKQYIPAPAVWLNGERWKDEIDIGEESKNSLNKDKAKALKLEKEKKENLKELEIRQMNQKIANKILELTTADPGRLQRIKDSVKQKIEKETPGTKGVFLDKLIKIKLNAKIRELYFIIK